MATDAMRSDQAVPVTVTRRQPRGVSSRCQRQGFCLQRDSARAGCKVGASPVCLAPVAPLSQVVSGIDRMDRFHLSDGMFGEFMDW